MEKNHFDKIIKKALENFETDYNPADWEAMKHRLEAEDLTDMPEMEDVLVDAVSYSSLENLEVPYEPAHWEKMAARLDEEFSFRRSLVYRYKIAEVALMLLAILTLVQLLPLKKQINRNEPVVAKQNLTPKAKDNAPIAQVPPVPSEIKHNRNASGTESAASGEHSNAATVAPQVSNLTQQNTAINKVPVAATTLKSQQTDSFFASSPAETKTSAGNLPPVPSLKHANTGLLLSSSFKNTMDRLSANASEVTSADEEIFYDCLLCKKENKLVGLNVGMFGIQDYHIIFTPYDEIFSWTSYTNVGKGYGGGLSFGISIGQRWEFQTGLVYSTKAYTPRTPAELYGNTVEGFVRESFGQFELDVLQIPLNIQYRLNKNSKWRFYTLGGASLNTVLQANYDREVEAEGFIGLNGAGGGRSFNLFRAQESDYITQKELNPGWFEGGSFKENAYLTVNAGMGLERLLTSRWSLFAEPSYQFHIFSFNKELNIGPNHDRINSIFIKTGVKVNLH